jgi:hypothetical protein
VKKSHAVFVPQSTGQVADNVQTAQQVHRNVCHRAHRAAHRGGHGADLFQRLADQLAQRGLVVIRAVAGGNGKRRGRGLHHGGALRPLEGHFCRTPLAGAEAKGANRYARYDVVGWGSPVRKDNYPADGRWYSSEPEIVHEVRGGKAETLIPKLRRAVAEYPWADYGDYIVWPGPNSNSFVAHIARTVPELGAELDPAGVGKDWLGPGLQTGRMPSGTGWQVSWNGLIGAGASWREGVELHFLGSTIGVDFDRPAIKLPALGRIGVL